MPITLRAGIHRLRGTWRTHQVETTIHVERDDPVHKNQFRCAVEDGQLRLYHGRYLLDYAPRPEPEVFAIQNASGRFWHARDGQIMLRECATLEQADSFTVHWIRTNRARAFIQTASGKFVTNRYREAELWLGDTEPSDQNAPAVFEINGKDMGQEWFVLEVDENVIGSDSESRKVRSTHYKVFGMPHRLVAKANAGATQPPPLPAGVRNSVSASSSPDVRRLTGHKDVIRGVVFTPDGKHVISGSVDGTIRFWSVQTGKEVGAIRPNRPVKSLAISGDGKFLAAGLTDAVVKLWSLRQDQGLKVFNEQILSRDYQGDVNAISFSPDGTQVAAARREVRIWNLLAPGERCRSSTMFGQISSLGWSRSGAHVLACAKDGSTHWWPSKPGREFDDARSGKVLVRSGDATLVLVGGDLLDCESKQTPYTIQQSAGLRTVSAQINRQGDVLVTGDVPYADPQEGMPDELVTLWNLKSGDPIAALREPSGQVANTAISADGAFVAYGSGAGEGLVGSANSTGDYALRLWSIPNSSKVVD